MTSLPDALPPDRPCVRPGAEDQVPVRGLLFLPPHQHVRGGRTRGGGHPGISGPRGHEQVLPEQAAAGPVRPRLPAHLHQIRAAIEHRCEGLSVRAFGGRGLVFFGGLSMFSNRGDV